MLEKYITKIYKKCKDILDDGNITDKEIDSLKEAVSNLKTYCIYLCRFNPPTIDTKNLLIKLRV